MFRSNLQSVISNVKDWKIVGVKAELYQKGITCVLEITWNI